MADDFPDLAARGMAGLSGKPKLWGEHGRHKVRWPWVGGYDVLPVPRGVVIRPLGEKGVMES